jgi:hypothetical protein
MKAVDLLTVNDGKRLRLKVEELTEKVVFSVITNTATIVVVIGAECSRKVSD